MAPKDKKPGEVGLAASAASRQAKTVLVVDDDPDLARLVAQILGVHYQVRSAHSAASALTVVANEGAPHLLVLDVMMPGIGGLELAKSLRKDRAMSGVPIVTTRGGFEDVAPGINAGARHYVTKPFEAQDLLAKVKKILG